MTQKPISRGENAGKLLEESEIRYQHLLKTTLDGILVVKGDTGELMDVNPALVKMLGFPREELQGNKFWEIGLFNSSKASQSIFQDLLRKETIRYSDISLRTKDGRLIHAELICTVYRVGRRKTIQCVLRDITEQRQALTLQDAIYRIAVAAETTKSLNDLFPEIHEIILSVMPAENFSSLCTTKNKTSCASLISRTLLTSLT